jgi:hypothetical protein
MLRSSKLWSGALGTTNTFVFALRLGSWALTLSKLTPRLPADRPPSRLCSLGEGEEDLMLRIRAGLRQFQFESVDFMCSNPGRRGPIRQVQGHSTLDPLDPLFRRGTSCCRSHERKNRACRRQVACRSTSSLYEAPEDPRSLRSQSRPAKPRRTSKKRLPTLDCREPS